MWIKKKKKLALLPNKDNAALNDDNHLQDDKMKMGGEWLNGIELNKKVSIP